MKEDLSNTWKISVAIKIMAPILWLIIIASIIFSVVIGHDADKHLKININNNSELLIHEVEELIRSSASSDNSKTPFDIILLLQRFNFNAIEYEIDNTPYTIGEKNPDDDYISHEVQLENSISEIRIFHTPINKQITNERRKTLFTIGPVFIVFGLILSWLIKFVVIRPLLELVEATQKISQGDMGLRINSNREDEFGALAGFFNRMMNTLNKNQEKLIITAEEAKQASLAKSTFLANMSHELRTPLNAIIGYSEILHEEARNTGNEQTMKDLNNIYVSGVHLLSLIDDILDISRIEAGKTDLYIEEELLSKLIENVIFTCKPLAEKNQNTLDLISRNPADTKISGDITKIRQILLNLIGNACKFTEKGKITLFVSINEDRITFTVTDTGIGINKEQLKNIFHPFHQADSSTTRKYGGSGLGLTISHHYCNMMGGNLTAKSMEGSGSVFKAELPLNLKTDHQ